MKSLYAVIIILEYYYETIAQDYELLIGASQRKGACSNAPAVVCYALITLFCISGDGLPLPGEQDVFAAVVSPVPGHGARPTASLAARQARPSCCGTLPATFEHSRHHRHVLHPRLQRQSELSSHSIAIIPELLRGGTVQNTNLRSKGGQRHSILVRLECK